MQRTAVLLLQVIKPTPTETKMKAAIATLLLMALVTVAAVMETPRNVEVTVNTDTVACFTVDGSSEVCRTK
jgi:hypothetical protein